MMKEASGHPEVRRLLASADFGESGGLDRLIPLVYEELRALARRQLAREADGHSLRTTALVHEAYLKLAGHDRVTARGRSYFFAAAARAMRQVLIDHARRRCAAKRGGGDAAAQLHEEMAGVADDYAERLLSLDRALHDLEARAPRQARVVECRFFGGLSVEETAEALEVSPRTVKYDWAVARAWLFNALGGASAS